MYTFEVVAHAILARLGSLKRAHLHWGVFENLW